MDEAKFYAILGQVLSGLVDATKDGMEEDVPHFSKEDRHQVLDYVIIAVLMTMSYVGQVLGIVSRDEDEAIDHMYAMGRVILFGEGGREEGR